MRARRRLLLTIAPISLLSCTESPTGVDRRLADPVDPWFQPYCCQPNEDTGAGCRSPESGEAASLAADYQHYWNIWGGTNGDCRRILTLYNSLPKMVYTTDDGAGAWSYIGRGIDFNALNVVSMSRSGGLWRVDRVRYPAVT